MPGAVTIATNMAGRGTDIVLGGNVDFIADARLRKRGLDPVETPEDYEAAWHDDGDGRLRFEIEASSFCHQMVRSITGMLVDVGRGRRQPHDVAAAVASKDRAKAGQLAPPHGLVLWDVRY